MFAPLEQRVLTNTENTREEMNLIRVTLIQTCVVGLKTDIMARGLCVGVP